MTSSFGASRRGGDCWVALMEVAKSPPTWTSCTSTSFEGLGGCLITAQKRREQLDEDIKSGNDEPWVELGVMLHEMDLRIMRRGGGKWEAMVRDAREKS